MWMFDISLVRPATFIAVNHTHQRSTISGLPFNDTTNIPLEIMELGQAILGDKVLAWQAGNEPDLYGQ